MSIYNLFDDFYKINRELDRVLKSEFRGGFKTWPEVNIYEEKNEYVVMAKVAGVPKDKINISLKDNALKITGERNGDDDKAHYYIAERRSGKFERNFIFDDKIDGDKITAEVADGILLVKLPKSEDAKPKSIAIK